MTDDTPPPPSWPPPALPPPTWPPPASSDPTSATVTGTTTAAAPARARANRLVLGVSLGLVGAAIAALVVLAAADLGERTSGDAGPGQVGPGYETLTEDEVTATASRATEIGAALDAWWTQQLPNTPSDLRALAVGDRLTDGDDGVRCDGTKVRADDDLLDNAWAALCREGPTVAYDPATFRRSDVALRLILAHEWGHIAQALDPQLDEIVVDPDAPFAETELQADCYAGAWARETFTAEEFDLAVAELRAIADPPGTPDDDPEGHGSPDEREAAFRLGVAEGLVVCLPDAFDAR